MIYRPINPRNRSVQIRRGVLQDDFLLEGTIREKHPFSRPDASGSQLAQGSPRRALLQDLQTDLRVVGHVNRAKEELAIRRANASVSLSLELF